jgi:hypothetical protein
MRTITVGALLDSNIFAGVDSTITGLPTNGSDFDLRAIRRRPPEILSFTILGLPDTTFAMTGSDIAAATLGRVIIRKVDIDNSGTPFGIAADSLTAVTDIDPGEKTIHWTDKQSTALLPSGGDFHVSVL